MTRAVSVLAATVAVLAGARALGDPLVDALTAGDPAAIELPSLFRTYLRYGTLVCGPPAIDREFKTIDFLVLLDSEALDPRSRALFFG